MTSNKQPKTNMRSKLHRIYQVVLGMVFVSSANLFAVEPVNLRVVWTESPQTKALIMWDSSGGEKGMLHLKEGAKDAESKQLAAAVSTYPKASEKKKEMSRCFSVALTNLTPDTKYFLTAQVDDAESKEHYFITAPDTDKAIKLFFAGDSRTRRDARQKVSRMISQMFAKDPSYIALLHCGDYANRTYTKLWHFWLMDYSLTTTADGRLLPIIPVRGNHEGFGFNIFNVAYGDPGGEGRGYYTFKLSPQVGIIVLNEMYVGRINGSKKRLLREFEKQKQSLKEEFDTQKAPLNEEYTKQLNSLNEEYEEQLRALKEELALQNTFLKSALEEMEKSKTRFRVLAYHSPLYPAIKGPNSAGRGWKALFEQFNVDLGLEADGHCIKRTVPIRGGKKADDGVVYLGEGGYGAPQRTYTGGRWYLEPPGFVSKGDHFMVLSFSKDKIDYFTMDIEKGIVDEATFPARNR